MTERSWVSRYIVPCPGDSSCKHCKPGEAHPQKQHTFSKLVRETEPVTISPTLTSSATSNTERERRLRRLKLMGTMFGNLEQVPFDPTIDPEPYACFICWSLLHMTRHCQESTATTPHVYCWNCGRRDVEVDECPRCARAYREYREMKQCREKDHRKFRSSLLKAVRNLQEEDLDERNSRMKVKRENEWSDDVTCTDDLESATPFVSQCGDNFSDSCKNSQNEAESNELFTIMRKQKMEDQAELDRVKREIAFDSESDCYFYDEEDENYDDYIVDEDEKSESLCTEDYTVRFFVDLLDALKHLSIDVQSTAVLNFLSARKKQISQIQMAEKIS